MMLGWNMVRLLRDVSVGYGAVPEGDKILKG